MSDRGCGESRAGMTGVATGKGDPGTIAPTPLDRFPVALGPGRGDAWVYLMAYEDWAAIPEAIRPAAEIGLDGRLVRYCSGVPD